jgi:hypothetical protein
MKNYRLMFMPQHIFPSEKEPDFYIGDKKSIPYLLYIYPVKNSKSKFCLKNTKF